MNDDSKPCREFRYLRLLTLPHVGILLGVAISFIAWALPPISQAGKGFVGSGTSSREVALTIAAYLGVAAASALGYYFGRPLGRRFPKVNPDSGAGLSATGVWTAWILLAAMGVGAAMLKVIGAIGIGGCIQCISTFNANGLKNVLYTDYSVGVLTLRYVAILAAGVAVYRYLAFREVSARSGISFALLMVVAVMSSRLSVIWAIVIGATAYVLSSGDRPKRKITMIEVLGGGLVFVVLVGALTVSRTFGYYEKKGANTFVAAVGAECQRYLAAPFQGSIEAVNYPHFKSRLNDSAGIDEELTTNSAFLQLARSVGKWNVVVLAAILFVSGLACGVLHSSSGTYLLAVMGILQCCHFEIWRILMFPTGITISLLATAITIPLFFGLFALPTLRLPAFKLRIQARQ